MPAQLLIQPPAPGEACRGIVKLPADQQSLLPRIALATLSRGRSTFRVAGLGHEAQALAAALSTCGVSLQPGAEKGTWCLDGRGLLDWTVPEQALDLRGESHAAALALALLAGRERPGEVWVDEIVAQLLGAVLQELGLAAMEALDDDSARIRLGALPSGQRPPAMRVVSSGVVPWVKEALLLMALRSAGGTQFEERLASADHLERALLRCRVPLDGEGTALELHPPRDPDALAPQVIEALGSPDALFAVLACMRAWDDGLVGGRDVVLNPARADGWALLRGMGWDLQVVPEGEVQGEPKGRVSAAWGNAARPEYRRRARAQTVAGEAAVRLGDGLFSFLAFACDAEGTSVFSDIVPRARGGSWRIVERAVGLLRSAGVECELNQRELSVKGRAAGAEGRLTPLRPLTVTSGGDARLVLLATALALRADGPSVIDDVECLRGTFPRWIGTLRALGADVALREVEG